MVGGKRPRWQAGRPYLADALGEPAAGAHLPAVAGVVAALLVGAGVVQGAAESDDDPEPGHAGGDGVVPRVQQVHGALWCRLVAEHARRLLPTHVGPLARVTAVRDRAHLAPGPDALRPAEPCTSGSSATSLSRSDSENTYGHW